MLSDVDGRVATFVILVEVDCDVVEGWVGSWAIGFIETAGPRDVDVDVDVDVELKLVLL